MEILKQLNYFFVNSMRNNITHNWLDFMEISAVYLCQAAVIWLFTTANFFWSIFVIQQHYGYFGSSHIEFGFYIKYILIKKGLGLNRLQIF